MSTERGNQFDMEGYVEALKAAGIEVWHDGERDGYERWHIPCPLNEDHRGKDAYLWRNGAGKGFHCSHKSCDAGFPEASAKLLEDHGVSPAPFGKVGHRGQRDSYGQGPIERPEDDRFEFETVDWDQLNGQDLNPTWLIKGAVVAGMPTLFGGGSKSLKTSIALDMALCCAARSKWLGHFDPPDKQAPAFIVSGESGGWKIRESIRRMINHYGCNRNELPLHFSFRIPQLTLHSHLEKLRKEIVRTAAGLVILDPAYLMLLSQRIAGEAGNLFVMGSVLRDVMEALTTTHATICLVHHTRKAQRTARPQEPGLEDFAYSGFAEFARQWVLVSRASPYELGSGRHELRLQVSGSCGQSGAWVVNIDEGQPDDPLIEGSGQWVPEVLLPDEAAAQQQDTRTARIRQRVLDVLIAYRDRDANVTVSVNKIREACTGLKRAEIATALDDLVLCGEARVVAGLQGHLAWVATEAAGEMQGVDDLLL